MKTWACLLSVSILSVGPVLSAEHFDRKAELARLKAHYVGKVVTVKMDLPRTDGGYVFINDDELDTIGLAKSLQGTAALGVETGGVGIPHGADVVIRDVKLKTKYVQFFLGTSTGAEWGKVVNTLSGHESTPHAGSKAEPISGSVVVVLRGAKRSRSLGISTKNARPLEPADLSIESLNRSLSQVVDTRPLASVEGLPPDQQEAIEGGDVIIGMPKQAVFMALGEPSQRQTELSGDDVNERWLYETETLETILVHMTNGVVTEVKRY